MYCLYPHIYISDVKQCKIMHIGDPTKLNRLLGRPHDAIEANKQSSDITEITEASTKLFPANPEYKHI